MTVKSIHDCVERLDFSGKEIFQRLIRREVIWKNLVRQFAQPVSFYSRQISVLPKPMARIRNVRRHVSREFFCGGALPWSVVEREEVVWEIASSVRWGITGNLRKPR
jgi:hypothetical protein